MSSRSRVEVPEAKVKSPKKRITSFPKNPLMKMTLLQTLLSLQKQMKTDIP